MPELRDRCRIYLTGLRSAIGTPEEVTISTVEGVSYKYKNCFPYYADNTFVLNADQATNHVHCPPTCTAVAEQNSVVIIFNDDSFTVETVTTTVL